MKPLSVWTQEGDICVRITLSRYWRRRALHLKRRGRKGNVVYVAAHETPRPGLDGMTWTEEK